MNQIAFVVARVDDHAGFDGGEHCSLMLRHAQVGINDGVGVERGVDRVEDGFEAFAGERRYRHSRAPRFGSIVVARKQRGAFGFRQQVDLVQYLDARLGQAFQFIENSFNLGFLFFAVRGGGVAYVQQYLCLCDFFKRGAEACDERVRQVADKSDRVR